MDMDLSLPYAMYLLCYDLDKAKMGDDSALVRGQLLRAAAVAALRLEGLLTDSGGKAIRSGDATSDPFLAEVLEAVPEGDPKRWFTAVDHRWHTAEGSVRDHLEAAGVVTVTRKRWLGVVPHRVVTPTDPERVRALRKQVREAVLTEDPESAPIEDAVLGVIAVDGDARTVVSGREHREHRAAVRAAGVRVEAELPGLRKALAWSVAARRTAATG